MFSLWGKEVWLYIGGIAGVGDKFGVYGTTGPMIGTNPDWAIGCGIHFGKTICLGIAVPIRQAMNSYAKHQDKVSAIYESVKSYVDCTQYQLHQLVQDSPTVVHGLEKLVG
jgi:hypothetical protein